MARGGGRGKLLLFSLLALLLILTALFADRLCPVDPNAQDLSVSLSPPSAAHLCGTDLYGRDVFSRVIAGSRVSILSALVLVAAVSLFGSAVGMISGFAGGWADALLMRAADVFLAFPGLVLALAAAALLGGGTKNAILALVLTSWPRYARLSRSMTLSVRESTFMKAARLGGEGPVSLLLFHVLPNIAGPVIVTAVLDIGTMLMELAGLSYLGLGAMPPTAEWGSMISQNRTMLQTAPWVCLAPGAAIFLTVLVFNLLGDTVRDLLDPKNRTRRGSFLRKETGI